MVFSLPRGIVVPNVVRRQCPRFGAESDATGGGRATTRGQVTDFRAHPQVGSQEIHGNSIRPSSRRQFGVLGGNQILLMCTEIALFAFWIQDSILACRIFGRSRRARAISRFPCGEIVASDLGERFQLRPFRRRSFFPWLRLEYFFLWRSLQQVNGPPGAVNKTGREQ